MITLKTLLYEGLLRGMNNTLASGAIDAVLSKMSDLNNGNAVEQGIELLRQSTDNETSISNPLDIKKLNPMDFAIVINPNNRCLIIIKKHNGSEYYIYGIEVCGYMAYKFGKFAKFNEVKKDIYGMDIANITIKKIESKENINICQSIISNV